MRIFDCTTYYKEDLMLEVRFNILDKYVDKFVIAEAKYSHSGEKKELNFDINNFSQFKKKIIYIKIENEPKNIVYTNKNNHLLEEEVNMRKNSIKRINYQRDKLIEGLHEADGDDYILYSDNDEIPSLGNIDFKNIKNKILIFKQKLFYYKFNLFFDRLDWFGTKACKKKDLISLSWLRDIKSKKYPQYRLDTIFSKTKYRDVRIVDDGGWHFSQVKTPKDIETKLLNGEQHAEFKKTGRDLNYIEDLVKRKIIDYDHDADSKSYKYSKEFKLRSVSINSLPPYLRQNVNKYSEWFDFNN